MCIRDRYQRRVHGEQKKAVKTKKEQAHHSKTMNSSIISSQEMNSLGYNAIKKFNECVAASGKTPTQIFQEADVNRDGRIKEMEFYKLIDSFDPKKSIFSLLEIVSLTKIADKDRSGSIDYNEFLGLCGQVTSGASTVVFPGSYTEKSNTFLILSPSQNSLSHLNSRPNWNCHPQRHCPPHQRSPR
eukprot:TRINITY_DN94_c0_g1_i4.p2 TRINITY_DN94_c0_g1~~TRINITY_DN94_c0_g1_i4.p2  ORF type:complete len:211 (+),score=74.14 TRINITY_DN94_c0_g1_i4:77-634(+)